MWPEDEYLSALGRAVYAYSYLEWSVICAVRSSGIPTERLAPLTATALAGRFHKFTVSIAEPELADEFGALVERRDDLLHAHPVSDEDGDQRLARWVVFKTGQKAFHITPEWLHAFERDCLALSRRVRALYDE